MTQRRIPEPVGGGINSDDSFVSRPAGNGAIYINNTRWGGTKAGVYRFAFSATFTSNTHSQMFPANNTSNPTLSGEIKGINGLPNSPRVGFSLVGATTTTTGTVNFRLSFADLDGEVRVPIGPEYYLQTGDTWYFEKTVIDTARENLVLMGDLLYMDRAGADAMPLTRVIPSYSPTVEFFMSLTGFDASFSTVGVGASMTGYELQTAE